MLSEWTFAFVARVSFAQITTHIRHGSLLPRRQHIAIKGCFDIGRWWCRRYCRAKRSYRISRLRWTILAGDRRIDGLIMLLLFSFNVLRECECKRRSLLKSICTHCSLTTMESKHHDRMPTGNGGRQTDIRNVTRFRRAPRIYAQCEGVRYGSISSCIDSD